MYGIEAITANNGWAQAIIGTIIVMSGLAILAMVISFLPKIVALFEGSSADPSPIPHPKKAETATVDEVSFNDLSHSFLATDTEEIAKIYHPLIQSLGDSFELGTLHKVLKEKNHPHPHLTIKTFKEAGLIFSVGNGIFAWKFESDLS